MKTILVIDDDKSVCYSIKRTLENDYNINIAYSSIEAFSLLQDKFVDLILLDYRLGSENGLTVLTELKSRCKNIPVVMLTAHGTNETVLESISIGAVEFLVKPVSRECLIDCIEKYALGSDNCNEGIYLDKTVIDEYFVGISAPVREIMKLVASVGKADYPVVITGESGVGKELVARLIHKYSKRESKPFTAINCAAIPEQLLESELFGYKKGAFTGADKTKSGKLEISDGGTIVLDEIADLPLKLQAKLLRVLQDGVYEKLGDTESIKADVRIIAITNKDLRKMVEAGEFRGDLYWRLHVADIYVPPLRDRMEDIEALTLHFIKQASVELCKQIDCIEKGCIRLLEKQLWNGNVRELRNVVRKAVMLSSSTCLKIRDFAFLEHEQLSDGVHESTTTLENAVSKVETNTIKRVLAQNAGNISAAARELGITRVTLSQKIKKYNL